MTSVTTNPALKTNIKPTGDPAILLLGPLEQEFCDITMAALEYPDQIPYLLERVRTGRHPAQFMLVDFLENLMSRHRKT